MKFINSINLFFLIFLFISCAHHADEQDIVPKNNVKAPTVNIKLSIRKSGIPGAGDGLYAEQDIPKDELIAYYAGKKVTQKEYNEIYAKKEHFYMFTMPECANEPNYPFIDGDRTHYASKANFAPDTINGMPANIQNSYFAKLCHAPYIALYAARDIKKGEEIFVSYGPNYNYHFMELPEVQEFFLKASGLKLKKGEKFTFKD